MHKILALLLTVSLTGCAHQKTEETRSDDWDGKATLTVERPDDSVMTYTKFDIAKMPITAVHTGGACELTRTDPKKPERFLIFCRGDGNFMASSTLADCITGPKEANLAVNYEGRSYYIEFACK